MKRTLQFDDFVLLGYSDELGAELDAELGVVRLEMCVVVRSGTYGWIWVGEEALVCESDEER